MPELSPNEDTPVTLEEVQEYHDAVYGEGPLAYLWEDKPHRVVIELCRETRALIAQLKAKDKEIERIQSVCAEAYQVAGALGATENVLDNLWAAASGEPIPHDTLLPYSNDALEATQRETAQDCVQIIRDSHQPVTDISEKYGL